MAKRIIICSDGTWNTPDQRDNGVVRPTNVTKTALSIAARGTDGMLQKTFYDTGVGTEWYDKIRGGISGVGISKKIKEAYHFLVDYYEEGDELFFFGFSRGAYTVRSTVGLIRNCGLLKKENVRKIDEAYDLYRRHDDNSHPSSVEAELFRKTYSIDIRVKFIGVWDTVGALGIPVKKLNFLNNFLNVSFHDMKLSSYVDNAFQVLAIDERREAFEPCIWEQQEHASNQCLEQIWCSGTHSNIGGGYEDTGLSDISFEWMREKAKSCGLTFDDRAFIRRYPEQNIIILPKWDGVIRNSKTGIYNLMPDYIRPIGVHKGANELVSTSAWERFDKCPEYKSDCKNLAEYKLK